MPVLLLVGEHNGLRSVAWAGFEQDSAHVAVDCVLGYTHRSVLSAFAAGDPVVEIADDGAIHVVDRGHDGRIHEIRTTAAPPTRAAGRYR
jgi:hypothetical protein